MNTFSSILRGLQSTYKYRWCIMMLHIKNKTSSILHHPSTEPNASMLKENITGKAGANKILERIDRVGSRLDSLQNEIKSLRDKTQRLENESRHLYLQRGADSYQDGRSDQCAKVLAMILLVFGIWVLPVTVVYSLFRFHILWWCIVTPTHQGQNLLVPSYLTSSRHQHGARNVKREHCEQQRKARPLDSTCRIPPTNTA